MRWAYQNFVRGALQMFSRSFFSQISPFSASYIILSLLVTFFIRLFPRYAPKLSFDPSKIVHASEYWRLFTSFFDIDIRFPSAFFTLILLFVGLIFYRLSYQFLVLWRSHLWKTTYKLNPIELNYISYYTFPLAYLFEHFHVFCFTITCLRSLLHSLHSILQYNHWRSPYISYY